MEIVKIPAERIGVLVGDDGKTKKLIEAKCNVTLEVDPDGEVAINGEESDIFFAKDVVKAIGRGFLPKDALKLLGNDFNLYVIPMREVTGSDKAISRLKGRVIGEKGKIKIAIEDATESYVSVFGNTIAIIAHLDTMEYAKEAVYMILDGASHPTVLAYLAKTKRTIMDSRLRMS